MDVNTFSVLTSFGSRLVRLGLLTYHGSRDEVLDIDLSSPLMFALRSGSLDELTAGVLTESGPPRFGLDEFAVPEEEQETISAVLKRRRSIVPPTCCPPMSAWRKRTSPVCLVGPRGRYPSYS